MAAVAISLGSIYMHFSASIYPGMPFGAGVALLVLAIPVFKKESTLTTVAAIIGVGLIYRLSVFLFPSSLIGFDPDAYAVRALIVAKTGTTADLMGEFYSSATLFSIFHAESVLIHNLPADSAAVVVPLVTSLIIPISAAAIIKNLIGDSHTVAVAALLTTLGPATVKYSTRFTPILFSALLFTIFAVLVASYSQARRKRYIFIICVLMTAMIYTHKLPLLVLAISVIVIIAGSHWRLGKAFPRQSVMTGYTLFILSGIAISVQWLFTTQYFSRAFLRIMAVFQLESRYSESSRAAAVRYDPGLFDTIFASGFVITTLSVGGTMWILLWYFYRYEPPIARLLGIVAATVGIALPGLFVQAAGGFQRTIFFATAALGALISIGYYISTIKPYRVLRYLATVGIILILISQPMSNIASPDYRDAPRQYLTEGEVVAKDFTRSIDGTVYMDAYFQDEVVDFDQAAADGGSEYQSQVPSPTRPGIMTRELTDGTLLEYKHNLVLLRTDVGVYRMDGGRWILTWDPVSVMTESPTYHRTYENGDAVLFAQVQDE